SIPALCAVSVLAACAGSSEKSQRTTPPSTTAPPAYPIGTCAPSAMMGVYFPARLHDRDGGATQDDCGTIRGKVMQTHVQADGDPHIKVQLDPQYEHYLAPGNQYQTVPERCRFQSGDGKNCAQNLLVLEIIPQHCHGHYPYNHNCADRGDFENPPAPSAGDYI